METAQTADYALRMLTELQGQDGLTVAELSARLGLSRSVAHRIAVTLHERSMLLRDDEGKYWLGPMLIHVARNLAHPLVEAAKATIQALSDETGETVVLAAPDGHEARVVAACTGHSGHLRVEYEVGFSHPLVRGASGLAILALLNPEARIAIAGDDLQPVLDEIKQEGFASTMGQLRDHMAGLAVPLLNGKIILGSLAIIAPSTRAMELAKRLPALKAAAQQIGANYAQLRDPVKEIS